MKVDFLIIGQGLAGTWLSIFARLLGASFCVVDGGLPGASAVASGVVNPVTGRGVHTTWLADQLIPFAEGAYGAVEMQLGREILLNTRIQAFPPSEEMLAAYQVRMADRPAYVQASEAEPWQPYFEFRHGTVALSPALVLNVPSMLAGWRKWLAEQGILLEETWMPKLLQQVEGGWRYGDVMTSHVLFAEGAAAAQNPHWSWLPFSLNKGEALVLSAAALPTGQVYKFGITTLVPWHEGQWWLGSSYDNRYTDLAPSPGFAQRMQAAAQQLLKQPFKINDHLVGLRPATIDRRPFVGQHPAQKGWWMLNGLGTKGCSLAPYFAHQLLQHILNGQPIDPAADLRRFERIFKRSNGPAL